MKNQNLKPISAIIIIALFLQILLASCENRPKGNSYNDNGYSYSNNEYSIPKETTNDCEAVVKEYNVQLNIKPCNSNKIPPEGYHLGEVLEYKGDNHMEQNMLNQFKSYNSALLRGDIPNAKTYIYPDAAIYFRKFYPDLNDEEITNEFFSAISDDMIATIRKYDEHGIELDFVVGRILRMITYKDNVFFVFELCTSMKNEKLQMYSDSDKTLAISCNNGKKWSFLAVNEDTPHILRLRYNDDIIDKIMGY
jgi:hypothetical protein